MMQHFKTKAMISLTAVALAACAGLSEARQSAAEPEPFSVEQINNQPFLIDWTDAAIDPRWYVSNHNLPNGHWKSDFRSTNVRALPNGLNVKVTSKAPATGEWDTDGGEIQYLGTLGFGEYHTIMKAAPGSGLVSSFFTYTGSYYGNPHDEIDFEFVGKSPYEVQLNAFTDGRPLGPIKYPVDFDTTKNDALYSFTWEPDSVTWYINGELVHRVTGDTFPIPQTPGLLMANLFVGREKGWVGESDFKEGSTAIYKCMSYRPLGDTTSKTCAEEFEHYR
mgnify:CR=1 FL=1